MIATVGMYFDPRMCKDGEFYAKYVIYHQRKQKYYTTGLKLDKEDVLFLKKYKGGLTGAIRDDYRRNLWSKFYGQTYIDDRTGTEKISLLKRAQDLIVRLGDSFTFEKFVANIAYSPDSKGPDRGDLISDLINQAAVVKSSGSIGDSNLYLSTAASLKRFCNRTTLDYVEVTADFLARYEKWMLREGKAPQPKKDKNGNWMSRNGSPVSITTVSIYTRKIRSMFNTSGASKNSYPFSKGGYVIPSSKNIKKALSKDDIEKIIHYEATESSPTERARDLWLFSYLSNGMNFLDLLNLKWNNYDKKNQTIQFTRGKTKLTKKTNLSKIQIDLFPISTTIIEKWGDPRNEYIFPFFKTGMSLDHQDRVKRQAIKDNNKYMRRIASELGITSDITTYTARHSFATILMQSEAPLAFIAQKLDHASIKTTENYLGSFESDQARKYLSHLLPNEEKIKP